ncbi:MAG TPA: M48 family metalloprotease [Steroidobacteraceae bacterium]|nr:M48 family metalloprotease [Steroidobacteraceae bacterium]
MSTQFFERQETQRKYTLWLVGAFVAAILLVVLFVNLVVIVGFGDDPMRVLRHEPEVPMWISLVVFGTILVASLYRSSQMREGGPAVARALGGVQVNANDGDFKRQRLVNIVEEMAIAARIRKPQVFVLPDEAGINAFAAGHSPDEAAVAVTQGALDAFDRDQLQAVIGHEFSHILNGDMKINMRLTAWIFGLCVITDLARRFMNKRGGGKDAARIKLIAFGVFLAGSAGAFAGRVLQAAVSRRREHLADASAVQFTRNPQALQSAFIIMAASASGTRLEHEHAIGVAHMFFAGSPPAWISKLNASWFATHPPLEERVRAIDARVTPARFRSLVGDERRKISARAAAEAASAPSESAPTAESGAGPDAADSLQFSPVAAMAAPAGPSAARVAAAPLTGNPARTSDNSGIHLTLEKPILTETMPTGVRMIAGRALPPDVLRNRLAQDQQAAIENFVARVESSTVAVQATFVAAMLASDAAKWRTQLTRLAPLLGIELFKETQAQIARIAELAPASRLPLLSDLLAALDGMEPADRKRLRAVARAFAPTVATGDMLRYSLTRMLEKRLAKAVDEALPVPLPERAAAVCEIYAALAQCRFGADKQGQNAYRAGLMGMLPPLKWAPYPEALIAPAALDITLAALAQIHPTGKRSLSEGMARVIAVGGKLTAPQVDLLRGVCMVVDCQVPLIPVDVVFDEADVHAPRAPRAAQASAR